MPGHRTRGIPLSVQFDRAIVGESVCMEMTARECLEGERAVFKLYLPQRALPSAVLVPSGARCENRSTGRAAAAVFVRVTRR